MIGEQFGEYSNEICGVVISIRHGEDVLSLWTRTCDNPEVLSKIRELFKKSLKLPSFVSIDFKRHDAHHQIGEAPSAAGSSSTTSGGNAMSSSSSLPAWRNTKEWRG